MLIKPNIFFRLFLLIVLSVGCFQSAVALTNQEKKVVYLENYKKMKSDDRLVESTMRSVYQAAYIQDQLGWVAGLEKMNVLVMEGNSEAAFRLGRFYDFEKRKYKDYKKAMQLYQLAAAQDHGWALNNIGLLYENGRGVWKDHDKALEYYRKAMHLDAYYGYVNMFRAYTLGIGVEIDQEQAAQFLLDAAYRGHVEAWFELGLQYSNLNGRRNVKKDMEKAAFYYEQAVALGYCPAVPNLAGIYEHGAEGVAVDLERSTQLYIKAAQCPGRAADHWKLGTRYRSGIGIRKNCTKALEQFVLAFDGGEPRAPIDIGNFYYHGCGDEFMPDKQLAFDFFLWSAKSGYPLGQNNVGAMLKHGFADVEADRAKGYAWLKLASGNGSEAADRNLEKFSYLFDAVDIAQGLWHLQTLNKMLRERDMEKINDPEFY